MSEAGTPAFSFSGGYLCLDLANTLTDRSTSAPEELLKTYEDLAAWSLQANILSVAEFDALLLAARSSPQEAALLLQQLRETREVIFRLFARLASGQTPEEADVCQFNRVLADVMVYARLVPEEAGLRWAWAPGVERLERPLWFVVRSAADLLTSSELDRARICASDDCEWLFLDVSKNRSRRWCDMKSCGNRAKAHRHYGRSKKQAEENQLVEVSGL